MFKVSITIAITCVLSLSCGIFVQNTFAGEESGAAASDFSEMTSPFNPSESYFQESNKPSGPAETDFPESTDSDGPEKNNVPEITEQVKPTESDTLETPAGSGHAASDSAETVILPDPSVVLEKADSVRSPWSGYTMIADIAYEKHGQSKQERYRVFVKDYRNTLVSYLKPARQRGNLLLMVDDHLWYYVNETKRPMRITPIQKLSGGTSYGDITRLNWSGDYDPEMVGEERVLARGASYDTWYLKLAAQSKSATYKTIDLYVEKESFFPRKAVVYLQSGKKMKTMYFTRFRKTAGKMMNTRIDFVDHLSSDSETSMTFSGISVKRVPDRFFLKSSLPLLYSEVVY